MHCEDGTCNLPDPWSEEEEEEAGKRFYIRLRWKNLIYLCIERCLDSILCTLVRTAVNLENTEKYRDQVSKYIKPSVPLGDGVFCFELLYIFELDSNQMSGMYIIGFTDCVPKTNTDTDNT